MNTKTVQLAALIAACTFIATAFAQESAKAPPLDYQKEADGSLWNWKEAAASPFYSISQAGPKYDIAIVNKPQDRNKLTYNISFDGRVVYSWTGHTHTVFSIQGNRLYYALFHPSASGGEIVAVNLNTGKVLWKSRLTALGAVAHSAYRNLLNLNANAEVVSVFGNESMGQYFEIKDAETGKTVGHKRFPKP